MANRRLLDYDPITKTTQWYHYDDATGDIGLETEQDVTDLVAHNKRLFSQFDERTPWTGDVHKVASIPLSIYHELAKISNNFKDQKVVRKWLNDPDNRVFRIRPGVV
jgi:uncharacterized protein (DUF1015 family)